MKPIPIQKLIDYDEKNPNGAGTALEEKLFLFSLVRMVKPNSIVEIGVSQGHLTTWLALALKLNGKGKLTSVDNWSRAHGGQARGADPAMRRLRESNLGLEEVVTFVESDSVAYLETQSPKSVDFVWIDGDHSFEGALSDIIQGAIVTKKLMGVHDTNQTYPGPRDAIKKFFNDSGFFVRGCRGIWLRDFQEKGTE